MWTSYQRGWILGVILVVVCASSVSATYQLYTDECWQLANGTPCINWTGSYFTFTGINYPSEVDPFSIHTADSTVCPAGNASVWNGTKLNCVDLLSGPVGPAGVNGSTVNLTSVFTFSNGSLQLNWSNGQSFITGNLTGPVGAAGATGPQGLPGTNGTNGVNGTNGINGTNGVSVSSAVVLANGSLNVTLSNGTSFISGNLTGPQGPQGLQGVAGTNGTNGVNGTNGINGTNGVSVVNAVVLANGSLNVTLSNGTSFISGNLIGPAGIAGVNGSTVNLTSVFTFSNGSLQLNWSNGQSFITGNLTGPVGAAGVNGSNASVVSGDNYIGVVGGVVTANLTSFDARYPNETTASIESLGFNTTTALKTYFDGLYYAISNPNGYITLLQALAGLGNYSADKTAIALNISQLQSWNVTTNGRVDAVNTTVNNLLNSNASVYAWLNSIGNWSADKTSYNTTAQLQTIFYPLTTNPAGYYNSSTLPATPYQSSAAGWTNTSTTTSTTMNVGIGTNTTSYPLDVKIASSGIGIVLDPTMTDNWFDIATPSVLSGIRMYAGNTYSTGPAFQIWGTGSTYQGVYFDAGNAAGADIHFRKSAATGGDALTILQGSGLVGVNNTAPGSTLDVKGNASVSGAVYSSGNQVCTAANGLCVTPAVRTVQGDSYISVANGSTTNLTFNETHLNSTISSFLTTTYYLPSNVSLPTGTLGAGNLTSLYYKDFNAYNVSNNFDVRINFTNVTNFDIIKLWLSYTSGKTDHYALVEVWNYNYSAWESFEVLYPDGVAYEQHDITTSSGALLTSNGTVQLRIVMGPIFATSDVLSVDLAGIAQGVSAVPSSDVNPFVNFTTTNTSMDVQTLTLTRLSGASLATTINYSFKYNTSNPSLFANSTNGYGINGNAATASSATFAGTATTANNSLQLGGQLPGYYWNSTVALITLAQALSGLGNATALNASLPGLYLGLHAKADTSGNSDTVTNGVYTTTVVGLVGNYSADKTAIATNISQLQSWNVTTNSRIDNVNSTVSTLLTSNTSTNARVDTLNSTKYESGSAASLAATNFTGNVNATVGISVGGNVAFSGTTGNVSWSDGVGVIRNSTCLKMAWNSTNYIGVGPGC